ncbi:hypothetical protein FGG08_002009 [Glutinoglossum americanum]|uniref:Mitochondrial adapter protein MCP1 transmembrane domain-containing protein n=1 Tax=Glutinoglossum americanum TaxID=1670608 RepID=A0A9P8L4U7_9PEZI|nr:hypothetical protein FGG08_002009 [Glutinoglossum americanum]
MDSRRSPDEEYPESLINLRELEPSPIESPTESPAEEIKDSYFPSNVYNPPRVTASSALGLGGHSVVYYLTRIQKYSSYTFSIFLGLHITNTSILPLVTRSVADSETYLLLTRPYYQSPLTEPLVVLLPLIAHIGSGVALRLYRRRQLAKRYGYESREQRRHLRWPALSRTSLLGYVLIPLVAGHTFVSRVLPLLVEGDSSGVGLGYISHGFAKQRVVGFVGFSALITVGAWHFVWGGAHWLGWTPRGVTASATEGLVQRKRRRFVLNTLSASVAGLWMLGGLGVVGRGGATGGWVGRGYDELYSQIPVLGRWV